MGEGGEKDEEEEEGGEEGKEGRFLIYVVLQASASASASAVTYSQAGKQGISSHRREYWIRGVQFLG